MTSSNEIQKHVFLTGGTGNLGRNLISVFGSSVLIHEMGRGDWSRIFFQQYENLRKEHSYQFILVHCAWPVRSSDYQSSIDNNEVLLRSISLFEAFKDFAPEGFIIGIGSILENGSTQDLFDDSPPVPMNRYAEAKVSCKEWLLKNADDEFLWARVAYQLSKYDPSFKLIPQLMTRSNDFIVTKPYNFLDFIHVGDVARSISTLLQKGLKGEMLISTGRSVATKDLALLLNPGCKFQIEECPPFIQITHPGKLNSTQWTPIGFSTLDLVNQIVFEEL